jgi:hypothetical protein
MNTCETALIPEVVYKLIVYSSDETRRFFLPNHNLAEAESLDEALLYLDIEFIRITQPSEELPLRRELSRQHDFLQSLTDTELQFRKDFSKAIKDCRDDNPHSVLELVENPDSSDLKEYSSVGITKASAFLWGKLHYNIEISPWRIFEQNKVDDDLQTRTRDQSNSEFSSKPDSSQSGAIIELLSTIRDDIRKMSEQFVSKDFDDGVSDEPPAADQGSSVTGTLSSNSSPNIQRHHNVEVTLFLVAVALANQLDRLQDSNPIDFENFGPFKTEDDKIIIRSVAAYVASTIPASDTERENTLKHTAKSKFSAQKKIEISLFLFANKLAKILDNAIKSGDFIAWQNEKEEKPENYLSNNGKYKSAPVERHITSQIIQRISNLRGKEFADQKSTAIQIRLTKARKNTTDQDILLVEEEDIYDCLKIAEEQYKQALRRIIRGQ